MLLSSKSKAFKMLTTVTCATLHLQALDLNRAPSGVDATGRDPDSDHPLEPSFPISERRCHLYAADDALQAALLWAGRFYLLDTNSGGVKFQIGDYIDEMRTTILSTRITVGPGPGQTVSVTIPNPKYVSAIVSKPPTTLFAAVEFIVFMAIGAAQHVFGPSSTITIYAAHRVGRTLIQVARSLVVGLASNSNINMTLMMRLNLRGLIAAVRAAGSAMLTRKLPLSMARDTMEENLDIN